MVFCDQKLEEQNERWQSSHRSETLTKGAYLEIYYLIFTCSSFQTGDVITRNYNL